MEIPLFLIGIVVGFSVAGTLFEQGLFHVEKRLNPKKKWDKYRWYFGKEHSTTPIL